MSRSNLWSTAVNIRGSALPSAAKRNKSHDQSKVFVRVSVMWAYGDYCPDEVDWLTWTKGLMDLSHRGLEVWRFDGDGT